MLSIEFQRVAYMFFIYMYMVHSLRKKRRLGNIISHALTFILSLTFCMIAGLYGWYGLAYNPMLQIVLLALLGLHIWFIHNDYVTMKPFLKRPMRIITTSTGIAFLLLLILYFVSCLEESLPVT